MFRTYTKFNEALTITVGNSDTIIAKGKGTMEFNSKVSGEHCSFKLKDVLFVPGLSANPVSVGAAAKRGVTTVFSGNECHMSFKEQIFARGTLVPEVGLFKLQIEPKTAYSLLMVEERSLEEWHEALGHIGQTKPSALEKSCLVEGLVIAGSKRTINCPSCASGKAKSVPHPSSTRLKATEVGELIHADLISPVKPASLNGSRYILL